MKCKSRRIILKLEVFHTQNRNYPLHPMVMKFSSTCLSSSCLNSSLLMTCLSPNCKIYFKLLFPYSNDAASCQVIILFYSSHILYTLVKQSRNLRAFKLASHVLEKLCLVKVPPALEGSVDLLIIEAKADPFEDNHDLQPLCYRCSTTNPLVNPRGNGCINCFQPFIYSFPSFGTIL